MLPCDKSDPRLFGPKWTYKLVFELHLHLTYVTQAKLVHFTFETATSMLMQTMSVIAYHLLLPFWELAY